MKATYKAATISMFLSLVMCPYLSHAMNTVKIKIDNAKYYLNIKYPQGYQSAQVNEAIKHLIEKNKHNFFKSLSEDENTANNGPGKSGLDIKYSEIYKKHQAISIRFDISMYHQGAAHPLNEVKVLNFINGHQVRLKDLFKPGHVFLNPIATFCKKEITAKKISDAQWINEGSAPTDKNYMTWFFFDNGISIVFNSYQVAAYVYGDIVIPVPKSVFASMMKPAISHLVWGG